jgi:hypothetical protein
MNLNSLNDDFRDLLLALAEQGVEFLIVGAYALSFYGAPRASGDIDVFVRPSAANAARIWMALVEFGAPVESAGVVQADFEKPDLVYQIGLPPRRIDLLTSISGVSFDEAWASRVPAEVETSRPPVLAANAGQRRQVTVRVRTSRVVRKARAVVDCAATPGERDHDRCQGRPYSSSMTARPFASSSSYR